MPKPRDDIDRLFNVLDAIEEWLLRTDDDLEPEDPMRDCPWKCRRGAPACLCQNAAQGMEAREGEDPSSGLHPKDDSPVGEADAPR